MISKLGTVHGRLLELGLSGPEERGIAEGLEPAKSRRIAIRMRSTIPCQISKFLSGLPPGCCRLLDFRHHPHRIAAEDFFDVGVFEASFAQAVDQPRKFRNVFHAFG